MSQLIKFLATCVISIAVAYASECDFHTTRVLLNYPRGTLVANHSSTTPMVVSYLVYFGNAYRISAAQIQSFTLHLQSPAFQAILESLPPDLKKKSPRSFDAGDIAAVYRHVLKQLGLVSEDSLGPSSRLISETELGAGIPTSTQQHDVHVSSATPLYAMGQIHRSLILAEVFMTLGFTVKLINSGPIPDTFLERFRYAPRFQKDVFLEIYPRRQILHSALETLGSYPVLKHLLPGRQFLKHLVAGPYWVLDPYGGLVIPVNRRSSQSEIYWVTNPTFLYTRRTDDKEDAALEFSIARKIQTVQAAVQSATQENGDWHALDNEILHYLSLQHVNLTQRTHRFNQGLKIAFHATVLSLPPEQGIRVIQRLARILSHPERHPTADGSALSINSFIETYATFLIEAYIKVHKTQLTQNNQLVEISYPQQLRFSASYNSSVLFLVPKAHIYQWGADGEIQTTNYAGCIPRTLEVAGLEFTYLGTHRDRELEHNEYYVYFADD